MSDALIDRFIRYAKVHTTADMHSTTYPSSACQLDLSRLLADELRAMGLTDATCNEWGIVLATIPATTTAPVPTIAWVAHVDTSPAVSGENVQPIVHRNISGDTIILPGNPEQKITVDNTPELPTLVGTTLITTDGTTLLGGDDKAGVAIIMQTAEYLLAHPDIPHGPIRICFTCDEEIGHGTDKIDLQQLGAAVAYTLDGGGQGDIDGETFSADMALVTCHGVSAHPGYAFEKMVNAVRMAAHFVDQLPSTLSPECTKDRAGFMHPDSLRGSVDQVTIEIILRDFDTAKLEDYRAILTAAGRSTEAAYPGGRVAFAWVQQYRNMADGLSREPRAVQYAADALRAIGVEPKRTIVRGGTDGSRLTEKGLPTPNLSSGQHNIHGYTEFVVVEEMQTACDGLVALAQRWAAEDGGNAVCST